MEGNRTCACINFIISISIFLKIILCVSIKGQHENLKIRREVAGFEGNLGVNGDPGL